jgi:uncharacterized protein YdiU (UPF0061 family)
MHIQNVAYLTNSIPGISDPRSPVNATDAAPALQPEQQARSSLSPIESFYAYQKEPWLADPGYEDVTSLEEYIDRKNSMDRIELALVQITYHRFQDHLESTYPDLAKKRFGFTLGPDANLKIINYSNALTEVERATVTELMNGFEDLKERIQAHAKNVMILAQHDHKTFGPARDLGLHNFHEIVDYHQVLSSGLDGMQEEWKRQVSNYSEHKDFSCISTGA